MRVFESLDEFKAAKGEPLGPSDWITITQGQINGFAESTHGGEGLRPDVEGVVHRPFRERHVL